MSSSDRWARLRIHLFNALFVLLFLVVVGRAYQLQIHSRDRFVAMAEDQQQGSVPLPPQRGTIYDATGTEMAVSLEAESLYAHPRHIENPKSTAKKLAKILKVNERRLRAKLTSKKNFVWLKRRTTPQESQKVLALKLPGINSTKEHKRFYPNSRIGAQIVGFTGVDPNGLEGVELEYDRDIFGQKRTLFIQRDGRGGRLAPAGQVRDGQPGHDIHLTLDRTLQYVTEKELAKAVKHSKARSGHAVVMEVDTGRVVAMASQPDFNPNAIHRFRPRHWRNRGLADIYEPGSTMKIFLMAAALQEKLVRGSERINCENGRYVVGGQTIHDTKKHKLMRIDDVIKYSSNIASAKIGQKLGRERLYDYLADFGFGKRTGIDLPGEATGVLRKARDWFEIDLAAISFGQGLSVTSLQMAAATAAIANGGTLMRPFVVDRIVDHQGTTVFKQHPEEVRTVVSSEVARQVREMMARVIEPGGTGTRAAIDGYRVAGKTGTAQKVDPVTGGYSRDKRVSSFVGFAPADKPRLVIVVTVDEPQGVTYGGVVAAPVFAGIAGQAMNYLQVPATHYAKTAPLPTQQTPSKKTTPVAVKKASSSDTHTGKRMPDFRGMSVRQVLQVMERTGLNIRLSGTGRVVDQRPRPHKPIVFDREAWVKFAPPA